MTTPAVRDRILAKLQSDVAQEKASIKDCRFMAVCLGDRKYRVAVPLVLRPDWEAAYYEEIPSRPNPLCGADQ